MRSPNTPTNLYDVTSQAAVILMVLCVRRLLAPEGRPSVVNGC